jgi:hypothetical protein
MGGYDGVMARAYHDLVFRAGLHSVEGWYDSGIPVVGITDTEVERRFVPVG